MNSNVRRAGLVGAILGAVAVTTGAAYTAISFQPESRVWVEGTSTVRSYTCEAKDLTGAADGGALELAALDGAVQAASLSLTVNALECGNGTMNGHMRKALKATEHGTISFRLGDYQGVSVGAADAQVKIDGTLTIAGQSKQVSIDGAASPAAGGALRVKGSEEILMSEYGVKAPSLMMGTMKVADRVKINFDVVLRQ